MISSGRVARRLAPHFGTRPGADGDDVRIGEGACVNAVEHDALDSADLVALRARAVREGDCKRDERAEWEVAPNAGATFK